MIRKIVLALGLAVAGAGMLGGPVLAQSADGDGMSEEQMIKAFQKQKTRGLVIAPSSQSGTTAGASTSTAPTDTSPGTKVNYTVLPKDEQVNINIQFDFDSAALRNDQKPKLVKLCHAMQAVDVPMYRILGHTDASGSKAYNQRLSKLRAEEVKRYLVSDCGIPADKLQAVGVGEDYLADPANPRAEVNRRVEFQALS